MAVTSKLRVHFITENDPLYVVRFFETFFAEYPRGELEIVGITVQEPFNASHVATAKRVLSLYGPVDFARLLAKLAVRMTQKCSVATLARRERITLIPTASVNEANFVQRIQLLRPDVIVSVAAPEIFTQELLQSARLGCINIHSGRLPAYRGMMPTFWQMRFGEPYATVTVHQMVPEIDAGAVLGTVQCEIREHDSLDRLMVETKREGARLMIHVLSELSAGISAARPLDMTSASYYSFPTREDARYFRRRGHRML